MAATASNAREPITGINVTPLVDVMLVLLIIFMATSSYITNPAIEVELPEAASGQETVETTIALILGKDGKLYLNGEEASEERVAAHCKKTSAENPDIQAIIAADGGTPHRRVVHLIDVVKLNGVKSFAINIDAPDASEK
jgi:biopolymer transport protein ExbD